MPAKRGRPRKHPPKPDKVVDNDVLEPKHIRSLPKRFAEMAPMTTRLWMLIREAGPVEAAAVGSADNAETAPDPKKKRERRTPRTREQIDAAAFIPEAPAPATEGAEGSGEEEMGEEETAKMVKSLLGTKSAYDLPLSFFFC